MRGLTEIQTSELIKLLVSARDNFNVPTWEAFNYIIQWVEDTQANNQNQQQP